MARPWSFLVGSTRQSLTRPWSEADPGQPDQSGPTLPACASLCQHQKPKSHTLGCGFDWRYFGSPTRALTWDLRINSPWVSEPAVLRSIELAGYSTVGQRPSAELEACGGLVLSYVVGFLPE